MSTTRISAGVVSTLVNRALTSVVGAPKDLEFSLGGGLSETADDALHKVLFHFVREDAELRMRVHEERGFAIGVEVTRLVMDAPLADHRDTLKKFITECIDIVKEHVAEDHRDGARA